MRAGGVLISSQENPVSYFASSSTSTSSRPEALLREAAVPFTDFDSPAFQEWFDRYGNARVVLLGEASHGTSEFYQARAAITRRLIDRHGFRLVAVEADWPDAAVIDAHVRARPALRDDHEPFSRFPEWMWRNTDVRDFVDWLHDVNADRPMGERAGFFGLDMYSMASSMSAVLAYLQDVDPDAAAHARERYSCLERWRDDPVQYASSAWDRARATCEAPVLEQLQALLDKRLDYVRKDPRFFDAAQNARLVASAERYYRTLYQGSAHSWNLRDTHMFETLDTLLSTNGPDAKAVVWAHNSHIGNAAATDMGRRRDEFNLGQLCRERYGDEAVLVGFGTHTGTVAAASDWDGPMEIKQVLPSRDDSHEHCLFKTGLPRFMLDLQAARRGPLRDYLAKSRLERFIGVIYRPDTELLSHYASACLADQFDALVWIAETHAVTPLPGEHRYGAAETWPSGL
jgi:erythromycin esterase-like protein